MVELWVLQSRFSDLEREYEKIEEMSEKLHRKVQEMYDLLNDLEMDIEELMSKGGE